MTICEVVHLHTIMVPTLERCSGRFSPFFARIPPISAHWLFLTLRTVFSICHSFHGARVVRG